MFGFINHKVKDLNEFVKCHLCYGYLIDATTIIECMHSFCKTCIMRHLEDFNTCPKCDSQLHETKPYLDVKTDKVLQSIVYQLFPSVFKDEMKRRREFHTSLKAKSEMCHLSPEKRGEVPIDAYSGLEDDLISVELVMRNELSSFLDSVETAPIYLLCPSILTIGHISKFLSQKFHVASNTKLCIFCVPNDELDEKYSIMDILCTYRWNKQHPLNIYYSFVTAPLNGVVPRKLSNLKSGNNIDNIDANNDSNDNSNLFFLHQTGKSQFMKSRLRPSLKSDVLTNVSKTMKII